MTKSRGRLIYFCAASYVFFFTILPSARTALTVIASAAAFGVAVHLIRRFDDPRARHAAFWALALSGAVAWAFDAQLMLRFDAFTGLLGMLGWGTCALAAASPEVLLDGRSGPRARKLYGAVLVLTGALALAVHLAAWGVQGGVESVLLGRALATVAALSLAVLLASQTARRRTLALAIALLAVAGLCALL